MAGRQFELITPDWPVSARVLACSTTRAGGVSAAPYDSLNLGAHVGDDEAAVRANRQALAEQLDIAPPVWLEQVHGTRVADVSAGFDGAADAAITSEPGRVCAVMTADCLPILLTDRAGTTVAAVHGGWRGLAAGIVEAATGAFAARGIAPDALLAWLGPAIGPAAYEVGQDVAEALDGQDATALLPGRPGHWQLDLYALARRRLTGAGVAAIYGDDVCTLADPSRFFSYRRDGVCGRQATLIWLGGG